MHDTIKRKRVALVIAHLGAGGAQRVAATAANALVKLDLEVHLFTVFSEPLDAYTLDPRVHRHSLSPPKKAKQGEGNGIVTKVTPFASAALNSEFGRRRLGVVAFGVELMRKTRALRRGLRRIEPYVVLSFLTQTNLLTLLAAWRLPVRVVISERNDPTRQHHHRRVVLLRNLLYHKADVVTANSAGAVEALAQIVPKSKLALLPNPLSVGDSGASVKLSTPIFITVTRLVAQKGIDVLLKAAARAFDKLPDWKLVIIGEGPLRDELQALAQDLGIAARVEWLGYIDDPISYLKTAKFFVLTSRFEGSPNALLEAMACRLPAVVSDASPGPLELIGDDAGLIVPTEDVDATAAAIVALATDENLRERLGEAAARRTEEHQLDRAMPVWLKLLDLA